MPKAGTPAKVRGAQVAWAGGAAILIGLLQFFQQELDDFNLRRPVLVLITAVIAVAGLLLGQLARWRAKRESQADLSEALDEALACWPLQSAGDLSPYDVGVRPTLDGKLKPLPYLERDKDGEIDRALGAGRILLVFGPAGAGKSRAAFEAVRRQSGGAIMLVPESAEGLTTLLRRAASLRLPKGHIVVWLDGFERYAAGLDVDPLDKLLQGRQAGRIAARLLPLVGRRPGATTVGVVATVRDTALEQLLDGEDSESYPTRRLLARGEGIFLPGELSDEELAGFERKYERKPAGRSVPEAFHATWKGGWPSVGMGSGARERREWWRIDPWVGVLGAVLGVLALLLWSEGHGGHWTVPPPLEKQLAALSDGVACPLDASPKSAKRLEEARTGTNAGILVAIVSNADCGMSDVLRFYRVPKNGRLEQISALTPPTDSPRNTFACRGPGTADPCHVTLHGSSSFIVGAFKDAGNYQELPVAVSFERSGIEVSPLSPPRSPRRGVPDSIRRLNRRAATLALHVGATPPSEAGADRVPCQRRPGCVRGRRAQATAVVPRGAKNPALLLAGYVSRGTTDAPKELIVRLWHLTLDNGRPRADRDCLVFRDGHRFEVRVTPEQMERGARALLDRWRKTRAEVMC